MTKRYYRSEIPESGLTDNRLSAARARLSRQGVIGGSGQVDRVSGSTDDIRLDVDVRGRYAERIGRELKEVLSSSDIEAAPFATVEARQESDAYYIAEVVDEDSQLPQAAGAASVGADLTKKGTRKTHWLAVETGAELKQVDHPFGNETTARVGIPAGATLVEAVDAVSQPSQREAPTPVGTVQAEHGDVDLYDISASAIDGPIYLYDLPYDPQGDVDPGVWDTYGHPTILDDDYVVAWGRVFDPSHEFEGEAVLENGLLRLRIDEPTNADETAALGAERWDPDAAAIQQDTGLYGDGLYGSGLYAGSRGAYVDVALPAYPDDVAADWQPLDVDLTRIGQARVAGQVVFEAVAADAGADADEGDTYAVNVQLDRGLEDALVSIPSPGVQGPMPSALQSLLEPVASSRIVSPQVEQTLIARQEVRL